MKTIIQKFNEVADQFGGKTALQFKFQGVYIGISYSELRKRVNTLAKALKSFGVAKGDKVAILSENRSEWVRTDLAALTLGAITVPIHTTLSPKLIDHILNDSQAKILLVSNQEQFNKVIQVISAINTLETVIYIDLDHQEDLPTGKKLISLEQTMEIGSDIKEEIAVDVKADDLASIIYTSGTTALPKGVMLTHNNFVFNAMASATVLAVTDKDSFLSFLPLSHVLERTAGYYTPLLVGGTISYAENVKTLKDDLKKTKPTILVAVPRIFEKVHSGIWDKIKAGGDRKMKIFTWALKQEPGTWKHKIADVLVFKKVRATFGGHLRFAVSGGASLNHKVGRFFDRMNIKIVEGYGLTETSPVISVNRLDDIKFGTVGKHLPGVEVMIAKDKEILTRGPHIMKGYFNNEILTKETIDADGWLHTGDLGFITSEGFLVIIGRKKEMIALSNGKIAWPEQLEILLNNDRFISQSMVYGNQKSYLTALIVPDWSEVTLNLEELGLQSKEPGEFIKDEKLIKIFSDRLEKINEQLADWEKIRKFVLLPAEFSADKDELTPTLKLRRSKIAENYQKQLSSLY